MRFANRVKALRLNETLAAAMPETPNNSKTANVDESSRRISKAADSTNANSAAVLAEELARGDEQYQVDLINTLADNDPEALATALDGAAGDYNDQHPALDANQKQAIRDAVGAAYEAGTPEQRRNFVEQMTTPQIAGIDGINRIADLISDAPDSVQLKTDFANAALTKAADPNYSRIGFDRDYAAAAMRAIADDPQAMANVLEPYSVGTAANGKTLRDVLSLADESRPVRLDGMTSLANPLDQLIDGAASLSNDTSRNLKFNIFRDVVDNADGMLSGARADATARLYMSDAKSITDRLTDNTDDAIGENTVTLSKFFQQTLFNKDSTIKDELIDTVKTIGEVYHGTDLSNTRPTQLGRLAGSIENGFMLAVEEQEARKEAVSSFVDLMVGLVPAGSSVKTAVTSALDGVVAQHLVDEAFSKGEEAGRSALTDLLVEKLTNDDGIFGWGTQELESRNAVDKILRPLFGVGSLPDANPHTPAEQIR